MGNATGIYQSNLTRYDSNQTILDQIGRFVLGSASSVITGSGSTSKAILFDPGRKSPLNFFKSDLRAKRFNRRSGFCELTPTRGQLLNFVDSSYPNKNSLAHSRFDDAVLRHLFQTLFIYDNPADLAKKFQINQPKHKHMYIRNEFDI